MIALRQRGATLVGILVGITVGLILLAGALTFFDALVRSETDFIRLARLNAATRDVMDLMHRDIRRAGYWSAAELQQLPDATLTPSASRGTGVDLTASEPVFVSAADSIGRLVAGNGGVLQIQGWQSPFQVSGMVLQPFQNTAPITSGRWVYPANPFQTAGAALYIDDSASCILYSYDDESDAYLDPQDRFGFRLNDGRVEMLIDAGGADCQSGVWEGISPDEVNIIDLRFSQSLTVHPAAGGRLAVETVTVAIRLEAQLERDPGVSLSLADTVRVRNDRFDINGL